jgi:hypothetical protein
MKNKVQYITERALSWCRDTHPPNLRASEGAPNPRSLPAKQNVRDLPPGLSCILPFIGLFSFCESASLSFDQVARTWSTIPAVVPTSKFVTVNPSAIFAVSSSWATGCSATVVSTSAGAKIATWVIGTSAANLVVHLELEAPSELTNGCQLQIARKNSLLETDL